MDRMRALPLQDRCPRAYAVPHRPSAQRRRATHPGGCRRRAQGSFLGPHRTQVRSRPDRRHGGLRGHAAACAGPVVDRAGCAGDRLRHRHHRAASGALDPTAAGHRRLGRHDRHRPREAGGPADTAAEFRGGRRRRASVRARRVRRGAGLQRAASGERSRPCAGAGGAGLAAGRLARFQDAVHRRDEPADSPPRAAADARHRQGTACAVLQRRTLQSAIARQGMEIVSVERHGTRGKDIRVFIVARKPA